MPPAWLRALLLEQFVCSAAMAGGVSHMLLDTSDFGLEKLDPLLELVDGEWAKILLGEQRQRIGRPAGEEIIVIHGGWNR